MTSDRFDVFLSYARADDAGADSAAYDDPARSFMRRLYTALTAAGMRVWWDKVELPSRGEVFTAEIERAIGASDRLVLVCGAGAATSEYVRAEWRFAFAECKPILPILLNGDYPLIPPEVALFNAIDFRPPRAEAAASADLVARLRQIDRAGRLIGTLKALPDAYVPREAPFAAARAALIADAIAPTVISAPQRAVAMYGMGGVGKSTLARALTDDCQIRRRYVDDVLWLEVGREPSIPALQAAVGVHFGDARENYPDEKTGALSLNRVLHGKQALIVLDDVWDAKVVTYFPTADTACRLLITTRSGALAGRVQGADIPLNALTPQEGARLIAARTERGDEHDTVYQAISARLGGHTLAVALAAAQIAEGYAANAADMLRLIDKRLASDDPFADLKLDETDKDVNLALSLGLSYDALQGDDLRRRFRALGAFAREGTFDRAALAAVWGDADPDAARAPLAALRGAGLIEDAADGGRFALHALIHAYAAALLRTAGEAQTVFGRYADWTTAEAAAFAQLPFERWGELDPLVPHILSVGDTLARSDSEGDDARLTALLMPLRDYFFYRRDQLQHRLSWFERVIAHLRQHGAPRQRSLLLFSVSSLYEGAGKIDWALEVLSETLSICTEEDDPREIAVTQSKIADLYVKQGRWDEALALYQESLVTKKRLNDPREIAVTQSKIADLYVQQGRWDEALALYQESLVTQKRLNDPRAIAVTQTSLGQLLIVRGERMAEAVLLLWQAYLMIERLGNPREIGQMREIIAAVQKYIGAGQFAALWQQAARVPLPAWLDAPPPDPQAEAMAALVELYRQGGEAVVRAALKDANVPEAVMAALLADLAQAAAGGAGQGGVSTLPDETVRMLAGNTVAVRTGVPEKLAEWRGQLSAARADWSARGADWAIEVAFADALLAILDGQRPALPPDNPYADVVRQVIAAIDG
jgi:tetratricopeptide (TPR) repeat protein